MHIIKDCKVHNIWQFLFQYVKQFINAHNSIFFQNKFEFLYIMQLEIIHTLYYFLANLNFIIEC